MFYYWQCPSREAVCPNKDSTSLLPFVPGCIFLFSHCAIGRWMQADEMAAKPLLASIKARMIRRM